MLKRTCIVSVFILLLILLAACGGSGEGDNPTAAPSATHTAIATSTEVSTATETPAIPTLTPTPLPTNTPTEVISADVDCPPMVQEVLQAVDDVCSATGRNEVCYGNTFLTAEMREGTQDIVFNAPGDLLNLTEIQRVTLSPLNTSENVWGVALMRLQANLPDTLPGQNVTFLLFGDVELGIDPNADAEGGIQSFYFRSGIGDSPCRQAPSSGILIQTPEGVGMVNLRVNDVEIALGSTAYLQAEPEKAMSISVIEGQAEVTSQQQTEVVVAGNQTEVTIDENLRAIEPPTAAKPYDANTLLPLPVNNLQRPVSIAAISTDGTSVSSVQSITPLEREIPPDPTTAPALNAEEFEISIGDTISDGVPEDGAGNLEVPGAIDKYSFSGTPGQEVYFAALGYDADYPLLWTVLDPLGEPLFSDLALWEGNDPGTVTLVEGTYTIGVSGQFGVPGTYSFSVSSYNDEQQTFNLHIGDVISEDTPQTGMGVIAAVGEVDSYTFTLDEETSIYFAGNGSDPGLKWALRMEGDTPIFEDLEFWEVPGAFTLAPNTYTLTVHGEGEAAGSYSFRTYEVPAAESFDIELGQVVSDGVPEKGAGNLEAPGANDIYTFVLTEDTEVLFVAQGNDASEAIWTVTDSLGNVIFEPDGLWYYNNKGPFTLPSSTYTISVKGQEGFGTFGPYQFQIYAVNRETFDIEVGKTVSEGIPARGAGSIKPAGNIDLYTFTLDTETNITFVAISVDEGISIRWAAQDEDGNYIFEEDGLWAGNDKGSFTLPAGTYMITVESGGADAVIGEYTGAYSFEVRAE